MPKYEEYDPRHIEWLKEVYPDNGLKKTTELFNEYWGTDFTQSQIKHRCLKNNIRVKYDTRFKKGLVTWNKGMNVKEQRPDIYEKYFGRNRPQGRFGFIREKSPIGSEFVSKRGICYVKISDDEWIPKARYVWEQKYGKLKKHEKILHLDGNSMNDDIDNLIIVDNRIICRLNKAGLIFTDGELTRVAVNQQKLLQAIKDLD